MEMVDLKTIAQFLLIGDPSIHPVATNTNRKSAVGREVRGRSERRKKLARAGARLGVSTAFVAAAPDTRPTRAMGESLRRLAREHNARVERVSSFRLQQPVKRVAAKLGRELVSRETVFHVLPLREKARKALRNGPRLKRQRFLVVREVDGAIQRVVEAVRH